MTVLGTGLGQLVRRRPLLAGAALVAVSGTAAGAALLSSPAAPGAAAAGSAASRSVAQAVAAPVVRLAGTTADGTLPWQSGLAVKVKHGTLADVQATGPDGTTLQGDVAGAGWSSPTPLSPSATYRVTATVADASGATRTVDLTARTTAPTRLLSAALSPGDDAVVGVGQPVAVRLDHPVTSPAARAAVLERLQVRTAPAVPGAWRWMNSSEIHYRAADFWAPGTKIHVTSDLEGLRLPGQRWGSGRRTSSFTVGRALTSVVDTRTHTMTVSRDGEVVRVMKASMGKPAFPTRNGTFLVLEKFESRVMDSATVDLPPGTPAYRTAVKHAVRLTYSGTFTHGAPWSVPSQGVANVSHGCINLSPADAAWYYAQATRGDVVQVVGSTAGPSSEDPGSRDWNMSFRAWTSA